MASPEENKQADVIFIELPAPPSWIKKFTPRKVVHLEEVILFSYPPLEKRSSIRDSWSNTSNLILVTRGPTVSEFDWGLGDSPRHSARLSEKLKAEEAPESESPKKKQRKSSLKKEVTEKNNNAEVEDEAIDNKNVAAEEPKESDEISMAHSDDVGNIEVITDETLPQKFDIEATEEKTEGEDVVGEPPDLEITKNTAIESEDANVEGSKDATSKIIGVKTEESKELAGANVDESKDAEKGTPNDKVEDAEKIDVNQNNSKEEQAAKIPDMTDMEPTVGK